MSKFTGVVLGSALALAGAALILAGPANAQAGLYADPSANVKSELAREHFVLSHADAVRASSPRATTARRNSTPNFQERTYADPDRGVSSQLKRDHLILGHSDIVGQSPARASAAIPYYASAGTVYAPTGSAFSGRDLSIASQR